MSISLFKSGNRIDNYLIERKIGKGGTSDLYYATDQDLQRKVVIKVLNSRMCNNATLCQRFIEEARIQANLSNPYIVPIFRMFEIDDNTCLVMQHIDGTDLSEIIKKARKNRELKGEKGALSTERAINIFTQILEGMGFIHKHGIIHGDIKPSNILIDKEGNVKIADFGLSSSVISTKEKIEKISPGGTPYFMSPEQLLGEKIDFRTDIYSLGVTFFNMLTGKFPFGERKKLFELLEFHIEGSIDEPKEILDEFHIDPRIREMILKAIENNPHRRQQSCLELLLTLKDYESMEMYADLLRISVLTKAICTLAERNYLDKISAQKGLNPKEAETLENNIRKDMKLPHLDFVLEYKEALKTLKNAEDESAVSFLDELDKTYIQKGRISSKKADFIKKKILENRA